MAHYHPWRHLRDKHPGVTVEFTDSCGEAGCMGRLKPGVIEIDKTSSQTERRNTLTHETHHHERGPIPDDPYLAMREEKTVEYLTAQTLVQLDDLLDAVIWDQSQVHDGTAETLWVELEILHTRVERLTAKEREYIETELRRRSPWTN